jgi:ATP sulfurylase
MIRMHLEEREDILICRVVETLRLENGLLFSMPITLDVSDIEVNRYNIIPGSRITLRDFRDEQPLAILTGTHFSFVKY